MEHPEALRVLERMKGRCPELIAREAVFGYDLAPISSPEEGIAWAKHLCSTLEQLPEEAILAIRMACRCSLKWGNIQDAKKIYYESDSLEDFVAKARQQLGVQWEVKDASLYVTYMACSCPIVNQSPEQLPRSWCYCTQGYNKDYFSEVFNTIVDVELLQAIKLGDEVCLMRVTPVV